ncbi:MAG: hypothetical protein FWG65_08695 [Turicibacter sp.]|nr:hypothetical protein [Turicibacter sp.]
MNNFAYHSVVLLSSNDENISSQIDVTELLITILGWTSLVAIIIIAVVITIDSIIETLKNTSSIIKFFPRLKLKLHKTDKNETDKILEVLGTLGLKLDNPHNLTAASNLEKIREDFRFISKQYIKRGNYIVGYSSEEPIKNLINLRIAYCRGEGETLSKLMFEFIHLKATEEEITFDCIVSRTANIGFLGYDVSRSFNCPFMLYDDNPIIKDVHFDYTPKNASNAIIVIDGCISADGLVKIIDQLRERGISISNAFCFYIRSYEGIENLHKSGVKLHYLEYYDDGTLESI